MVEWLKKHWFLISGAGSVMATLIYGGWVLGETKQKLVSFEDAMIKQQSISESVSAQEGQLKVLEERSLATQKMLEMMRENEAKQFDQIIQQLKELRELR